MTRAVAVAAHDGAWSSSSMEVTMGAECRSLMGACHWSEMGRIKIASPLAVIEMGGDEISGALQSEKEVEPSTSSALARS